MKKQMEWVADKNATACPTYNVYRYAVWLYVVLLVFEGALRKWVLPSLATPLLVVRDPIAIWLVVEGLRRKWFVSPYFRVMMIAATLSFFLTLVAGHHNLLVALFGWRIYFFHFPMILVIGKVLARDELLRMLRFFLYLSVPMTLLVVVQFYSPDTAWVNIGVGGEGTAGFGGAMGYMRPPGTFSFTSGYVAFQGIVGCSMLYYLAANRTLDERNRMNADMPLHEQILVSLFSSVTPRTAGYNSVDTAALCPGSKLLTIILMFIGGSSGSTAGGVKTSTIAVLAVCLASGVVGKRDPEIFGRRISNDDARRAGVMVFMNLSLALIGALLISLVQDFELTDILFEVFSAMGTVGMTTGITRDLCDFSAVVIVILMYLGRVGSISFAMALLERRAQAPVRCPEEAVTIG